MNKYRMFGACGREEPSQSEMDFLLTPLSDTAKDIRVRDVMNTIMEHPYINGVHIYSDHARIDTVFVDDRNEYVCLCLIRSTDGGFMLIVNDSSELFAFSAEGFEKLGIIAEKHGLMLDGGAFVCECDHENTGEQIDKFVQFWREIEIIH